MHAFLRQSGFTLLEMVIAMGLFAMGLLGLGLMTSGLMANNTAARNRADATQLAQNKMEVLGRSAYLEITDSLEVKLDGSEVSGDGPFRREVAVVENTDPLCKEVTVTVSWEAKGTHRVVLKTVFSPD